MMKMKTFLPNSRSMTSMQRSPCHQHQLKRALSKVETFSTIAIVMQKNYDVIDHMFVLEWSDMTITRVLLFIHAAQRA